MSSSTQDDVAANLLLETQQPEPGSTPGNNDQREPNPRPPVTLGTMTAFLSSQRLLHTTIPEPAVQSAKTIFVPVNFNAIKLRLDYILNLVFQSWPQLHSLMSGTNAEIFTACESYAKSLSCATIYLLYARLRNVHYQFAPGYSNIYRTRPKLDLRTVLPSGLIYIINQFGISKPKDVVGNCSYLHHWDNEHANEFGIATAADFNHVHFLSAKNLLVQLNVPFTYIERKQEFRTSWDTIKLTPAASGFSAYTTMPSENYSLPRDVFLQATVNFTAPELDFGNKTAVHNYAMKLTQQTATKSVAELPESRALTLSFQPQAKKRKINALSDTTSIDINQCLPHLFNQYTTETGVVVDKPLTGTTGINPSQITFGQGTTDNLVCLKSVHRELSPQYLFEFWFALITKGP